MLDKLTKEKIKNALAIAAESMGIEQSELERMITSGQVSAHDVLPFLSLELQSEITSHYVKEFSIPPICLQDDC